MRILPTPMQYSRLVTSFPIGISKAACVIALSVEHHYMAHEIFPPILEKSRVVIPLAGFSSSDRYFHSTLTLRQSGKSPSEL